MKGIGHYVVVLSMLLALAGLAASCGEDTAVMESGDRAETSAPPTTAAPAPEPSGDRKAEEAEATEAAKAEAKEPEPDEVPAEPVEEKQGAGERATAGAATQHEQQTGQYADVEQYEQEADLPADAQYEQQADVEQYDPPPAAAAEGQYDTAATDAQPEPQAAAPAGNSMSLSVPALGLAGVPVVDGFGEAALGAGTQHVPGTGFPWMAGSNTYIAGHRIGYAGTPSDHVFYSLPNLGPGDAVILTDENGNTYEYAVTEIMEVSPTDLWVMSPVAGRDVVTLQTCIEDFGDYWTEGPNWFARYVVRADRV